MYQIFGFVFHLAKLIQLLISFALWLDEDLLIIFFSLLKVNKTVIFIEPALIWKVYASFIRVHVNIYYYFVKNFIQCLNYNYKLQMIFFTRDNLVPLIDANYSIDPDFSLSMEVVDVMNKSIDQTLLVVHVLNEGLESTNS